MNESNIFWNFLVKVWGDFKRGFKVIFDFTSIKKGLIRAYNLSLLPDSICKFYSHIFVRILRVIGGFCVVLVFTLKYNIFFFPAPAIN